MGLKLPVYNYGDLGFLKEHIEITDEVVQAISRHYNRYYKYTRICAWYRDWEDFCSDWCDGVGYTRTQARKLLHGGKGQFMKLPGNKGIVMFSR